MLTSLRYNCSSLLKQYHYKPLITQKHINCNNLFNSNSNNNNINKFIWFKSSSVSYGTDKCILREYSLPSNQLPGAASIDNYSNFTPQQKRLLFRSKERGMLESDLLLGTFASENLNSMSQEELDEYEEFLNEYDPDIVPWLTGRKPLPDEYDTPLIRRILKHVQNDPLKYHRKTIAIFTIH